MVPRARIVVEDAMDQVRPIVADVADRGLAAVEEWSDRLDKTHLPGIRVPEDQIDRAVAELDVSVRSALHEAIVRTRRVHKNQLPRDIATTVVPGGSVTQRWIPVGRVGLYVPGGRAAYPSSVVMNVVPAQTARVASIAVTSPPQVGNHGLPNDTVLAVCGLLGIREVYSAGGAQAVAMLAYGTDEVSPVDIITGPGNIWVTAAKRLVLGRVGIDAEAGPTEVMVIADDSADARVVASDLISQAEHDTLAAAVLVTNSEDLAEAVVGELSEQVAAAKHRERITAALGGVQSAIVLVENLGQAVAVADDYAAEHLEIHTRDAREWADRVKNAGAIFVGGCTPVSLGDYAAGSNHVLPTGGTALHSSGLGVPTFLRRVQVVEYDHSALSGVADVVRALAHSEDLPAHAAAIDTRIDPHRQADHPAS
jgi:histidinol dehydrogenase